MNRLAFRVLEQIPKIKVLTGPTDVANIKPEGNRFRVPLGSESMLFDRVIIRHGPSPATLESAFNAIWKACTNLHSRWKNLQWQKDLTRKPLWPDDFFGPESATAIATVRDEVKDPQAMISLETPLDSTFQEMVNRYGIQALALEVRKRLRDDGVATVEYAITGLSTTADELTGMRFYYESTFGQVGRPILDETAQKAGFTWEDDYVTSADQSAASFDEEMQTVRNRVKKMAGIVRFPAPLHPSDPPLTLALTIKVLNGDALSGWEFEQLYEPENRVHVNGDPLTHAMEYMARVVWFPIRTLKLTLTLPGRSPGPAFPSVFMATDHESIPSQEIVSHKVLQMYPRESSAWQLPGNRWLKAPADVLVQTGQFMNIAPQSWELSVQNPVVGSCYSLDWRLPSSSASNQLINKVGYETALFRRKLLSHREQRLIGKSNLRIQAPLKEFYAKVEHKYRKDPKERLAISVMTYDELDHRLKLVDGVVNRGEPDHNVWGFWLPFGAGLAGACFKQQSNNPLIYFAPSPQEVRTEPEVYFPFPNRERHTVLIALPLTHPAYPREAGSSSFESARARLAVIDISSNSETTNLLSFNGPAGNNNFRELIEWCECMTERLCTALGEEKTN